MEPLLAQQGREFIIRQRVLLIFVVYSLLNHLQDLSGSELRAILGGIAIAEEMLQAEDAEVGLHILTIAHTRHGRDIELGMLRHILQDHGMQLRLVASEEEVALQLYDGPHGGEQRLLPLSDSIDEVLRLVDIVAQVFHRILGLLRLQLPLLLRQSLILLTDVQFWHVLIVQRKRDVPIVARLHDKVGHYLLEVLIDRLPQRSPRARIQARQFLEHPFEVILLQPHALLDLLLMLMCELLEILRDDGLLVLQQRQSLLIAPCLLLLAPYLYEQAFLQAACPDARRVELLHHAQHLQHLLLGDLYALIDKEIVHQSVHRLAQQSVIIQRPYQILGNLLLLRREVMLCYLCPHTFIERGGVAERNLAHLLPRTAVVRLKLVGRDLVIIVQQVVVHLLIVVQTLLAALVLLIVLLLLMLIGAYLTAFFQRRIVYQLIMDALLELHGRQFQQLHHHDLLCRELLHLYLRLRLDASHLRILRHSDRVL